MRRYAGCAWFVVAIGWAVLAAGAGRGEVALARAPASLPARAAASGAYVPASGPFEVGVVRFDWTDKARGRDVPAKIYFPKSGDGPFPIIVFSHGTGGSRETYEYAGHYWASCGYVSVHVQHAGSDTAIFLGAATRAADSRPTLRTAEEGMLQAVRKSVAAPANATNRVGDVKFALDQIEKLNETDATLKGRLNLKAVGVAGHSFGAWTAQMVAGESAVGPLGRATAIGDPRVTAAVSMSPYVPGRISQANIAKAFESIRIPCLFMTGTLDDSPIGDTKAGERRTAFDDSKNSERYLVIFKDADHMVFSGRGLMKGNRQLDAAVQGLILQSTTAFWDAYLKGDARAKAWLADGGFAGEMGPAGTFEQKKAGE